MAVSNVVCRISGIVTYSNGKVGTFEASHDGKAAFTGSTTHAGGTQQNHALEVLVGEKSPLAIDSSEFILQDTSTSLANKTAVATGDEYIKLTSLTTSDDPAIGTVTDYVLTFSGIVSYDDDSHGSFSYVFAYDGGVSDTAGGAISVTGSGTQIVNLIGGTAAYLTRVNAVLDNVAGQTSKISIATN
tara:strand:- start:1973 stop:2533 length:561 start_codon:yes stop_codon:yes gene_type:complete